MRVFKFGGASVKDASSIQNVSKIIQSHIEKDNPVIVVVSALGKTTNKLERIAKSVHEQERNAIADFRVVVDEHKSICDSLDFNTSDEVYKVIENWEEKAIGFISRNESKNYNFIYDQIVSKGEFLSTNIVYHFLKKQGVHIRYTDARDLIRTDRSYTDAIVHWDKTQALIDKEFSNIVEQVVITQGFVAANAEMLFTTLGREGSDFTAAIIAKCTNTKELTIWKDVDGVYTADPKKFPEATIVPKLSYKEAVEMTFYGAQIIHPKTIKPIQNSNCILKVKSFINTDSKGTEIGNFDNLTYAPATVLKESQMLYSFSIRDFSFLNESNLGKIIATFGKYHLRINLMQNTAIDFIVLTDEKIGKNEQVIKDLESDFDIKVNRNLKLLTIRHYTPEILEKQRKNEDVLLVQKTDRTIQYLIKS